MSERRSKQSPEEGLLIKERVDTKEPPMYRVVLLNDHYTTMEFVIMVLQTVFRHSAQEAERIMLQVHENGEGVAGVFTREVAETKIAIVHQLSRQSEFPLRCTLHPE